MLKSVKIAKREHLFGRRIFLVQALIKLPDFPQIPSSAIK